MHLTIDRSIGVDSFRSQYNAQDENIPQINNIMNAKSLKEASTSSRKSNLSNTPESNIYIKVQDLWFIMCFSAFSDCR